MDRKFIEAAKRRRTLRAQRLLAAALAGWAFSTGEAAAQPTAGKVIAGQATINALSSTSTLIRQSSGKAIITWSGFSISAGASVIFQQPGPGSIVLNRVTGGVISNLMGTLSANGQVWLVNPAGIVVGSGAHINVAGLLLSTADLSNGNFLSGNYNFNIPGNPDAAVVNHGQIVAASGGSVVLGAPQVTNDGLVEAELGTVVVAGAKTFAVDFAGDNLLSFAITGPVTQVAQGTGALVANGGTLAAQGGRVLLTASAAKGVLDNVINVSGIVEATSASVGANGQIVLSGSGGAVTVSGTLDASGKGAGQTGGTVEVLGDRVNLAAGAKIDVSGDAGGGTALVGGNFHGAGPQANAAITTVAAGATIDADAITSGNGGRVAVWSEDATDFAGSITARGGAEGGNGGYVETSGGFLSLSGTVDTSAAHGATGTWLLDPDYIDIESSGVTTPLSGGTLALGQDPGGTDILTPGEITSALSDNNVNLQAAKDITVDAQVSYTSGNSLDLMSEGTIHVNASIQNQGSGNITLVAGWNGSTVGPVVFGSAGGDVFIGNGSQSQGIALGTSGGTTTVFAENLTLQGGSSGSYDTYAQLGYNGGSASGAITVDLTGNLALLAGSNYDAYAQIGNGGAFSSGNESGAITVTAGGDVTLSGGAGTTVGTSAGNYAQIGHGGLFSTGDDSGNISITARGSGGVLLAAGDGGNSYAQIGHGGDQSSDVASGDSGAITILTAGDVLLEGSGASNAYAQIGHGGVLANSISSSLGSVTGNITIGALNMTLAAGDGGAAYAQIGHGGYHSSESTSVGTITLNLDGSLSLTGGDNLQETSGNYAQVGHGGAYSDMGSITGSISVGAAGGVNLSGGTSSGSYAQVGHGGADSYVGVATGDISVGATTMTLAAGAGGDAYAQVGHGGLSSTGDNSGNISITAGTGGVMLFAGNGGDSYVQIGHGGDQSSDVVNGDSGAIGITTTTGDVVLQGGGGPDSYAQIGHGGFEADYYTPGTLSGDITIGAVKMTLAAGDGGYAYAQVGHGGYAAYEASVTGNIALDLSGNLSMSGGTGSDSYAQIGHGGADLGGVTGNITIGAVSMTLAAGDGGDAYAQVGHGGYYSFDSSNSGNITVTLGTSLSLSGGDDLQETDGNYAQIGHGGLSSVGVNSGAISIMASSGGVILTGGASSDSYAQIGHGGDQSSEALSDDNGDISITTSGNVTMLAGSGENSYVQIGHGGALANASSYSSGSITGDITVGATSMTLTGNGGGAYAQVGQGGYGADETAISSNITLNLTGSLSLSGGSSLDAYAQIGGGAANGCCMTASTVAGDIAVTAGGTITLVQAGPVDEPTSLSLIGNVASPGSVSGSVTVIGQSFVSTDGALEADIAQDVASGPVTITSTGTGALALIDPVVYASTDTLSITASSGSIVVDGGIANSGPGAVTLTAGTIDLGSDIATAGGTITLSGATVLTGAVSISTGAGAQIDIGGTVDAATAGGGSLTLSPGSGSVTVLHAIGGSTPLGAFTVDGASILDASITTAGAPITFDGPVVLGANVALTTTGGGASAGATVTFAGTLDGLTAFADNLTIAAGTAGNIDFEGRVGSEEVAISGCCSPGALGTTLGAVTIPSADNVSMTVPTGSGGDGFSAASFTATGIQTLASTSFISTAFGPFATSGSVTITAQGAVAIGTGIPPTSTGSGSDLQITSQPGIDTSGNGGSGSIPPSNGGAISITGSSISLPAGARARGGGYDDTAVATDGANGGAVTLTAVGGAVTIGSAATGPEVGIDASGGNTYDGSGGAGGNVLLSGQTLALSEINTTGGSSKSASVGAGDTGGSITLIATATSGAAVTLYGTANGTTGASPDQTLLSAGGESGAVTLGSGGNEHFGVLAGAAGNITIEGSAGGAALQGTSFVQLATSSGAAPNGGSVVIVAAPGGVGGGGTVTINGPVQGTTANTETLHIDASNGALTIDGPVGTITALNSLVVGFIPGSAAPTLPAGTTEGTITLQGPVTVGTEIDDLRTNGALVFNGLVTTPDFTMNAGTTSLELNGGTNFSGHVIFSDGPLSLGGIVTLADGADITGALTLSSATTFDSSGSNASITISAPINGISAGGQSLTLRAGSGTVTIDEPLGGSVPLGAVRASGGSIVVAANVSTANAPVTLMGPVSLQGNVTIASGGGAITFANTVDAVSAGYGTLTLDAGGGTVTLEGDVGDSQALGALTASGGSILLGGSVTTTGSQTYDGAAVIYGESVRLSGLDLTFNGTIDGPGSLSLLNAGNSGTVVIAGIVGGTTPLASLEINGNTIVLDGSVTTINAQTYTDTSLELSGGSTYETYGGSFTQTGATYFSGSAYGTQSYTINTTGSEYSEYQGYSYGGTITFTSSGSIDGRVALNLDASTSGTVEVGTVGANEPLLSLNVIAGTFIHGPIFLASPTQAQPDPNAELQTTDSSPPPSPPPPPDQDMAANSSSNPPPPPPSDFVFTGGPPSSDGGDAGNNGGTPPLQTVSDLDKGSQLYSLIDPGYSGSGGNGPAIDPVTYVAPITPAPQPLPLPQPPDESLGGKGSYLFRTRTFFTHDPGVPGIDQGTPASGNRALWFANQGGSE